MTSSVLLVDDSAVQATTRRMILERAGYRVTVCLDAAAALKLLEENGCEASYSIVLTDHIMPSLSGKEFVVSLRETCPHVPVLVLSGLAEAEDQYAGLGIEFHLKPFAPDDLLAAVARMIDDQSPMVKSA